MCTLGKKCLANSVLTNQKNCNLIGAAILCEPLLAYVTSVNSTLLPGSHVNVTCPDSQPMSDEHQWAETVCSAAGLWIPAPPDCTSELSIQPQFSL